MRHPGAPSNSDDFLLKLTMLRSGQDEPEIEAVYVVQFISAKSVRPVQEEHSLTKSLARRGGSALARRLRLDFGPRGRMNVRFV